MWNSTRSWTTWHRATACRRNVPKRVTIPMQRDRFCQGEPANGFYLVTPRRSTADATAVACVAAQAVDVAHLRDERESDDALAIACHPHMPPILQPRLHNARLQSSDLYR